MNSAARIAVFTDFDETLTTQNVAQFLLHRFAPDSFTSHREQHRKGEITFRKYQELSFDAVTAPVSEMQAAAADDIKLREGVQNLARAVVQVGGMFTVLSAGLRFYIDAVLEKHGLDQLPVICGTATRDDESGLPDNRPFRYDYPFTGVNDKPCRGDWATCKCRAVEQAGEGVTTVFVGDGSTSDACVAPRADFVFARDRLLNICIENGIKATPFDDLRTVAEFVTQLAKNSDVVLLAESKQK
jgi:2-hydroxy-3-keto-5-methylthiopentenyl-1-phosphate phosphatase